jgi:glycine/D-amino acid oxidase-like deaminating enzyme
VTTIDVLIVGQGLAGSLLAWELVQRQRRVLVVDDGAENASRVAAGLVNPITGPRLVKTRDSEMLLPTAMACYQSLSAVFNTRFFYPLPMLRRLTDAGQQRSAFRRLQQPDYQPYFETELLTMDGMDNGYGWLQQRHTGSIRLRKLLDYLRSWLMALNSYRCRPFDYADLVTDPALRWHDVLPGHVVFCEGYKATANPWFGQLPFQLAKGELLTCDTDVPLPPHILNYGHWILPIALQQFKTGATFDPNCIDLQPSSAAQHHLLNALAAVCPRLLPVRIRAHQVGIRPATLDKQPFIGTHPKLLQLHIFNGFGAKGGLYIPWYAACLADALARQSPLPGHVDIARYHGSRFTA